MAISIIRDEANGGYRVYHRPGRATRARWRLLGGPVFWRAVAKPAERVDLVYLQYGMGDGPWIVMRNDNETGRSHRIANTETHEDHGAAVAYLRALADAKGWREVTESTASAGPVGRVK